jgi:hypothetical protein
MAIVKAVSFKNKEQDLLDHVGKRDFSYYVKDLIRKDMNEELSNKAPSRNENITSKKRNINFEF